MKFYFKLSVALLFIFHSAYADRFSDYFKKVGEIKLSSGKTITGRFYYPYVQTLTVDKAGNFLVCDVSGKKVLLFDPAGKLVRTIIKTGEGPGEVQQPVCITISDDHIILMDAVTRRLQFYDRSYNYLRAFLIKSNHTQPMKIIKVKKNIIGTAYTEDWASGKSDEGQTMVKYSIDGKYLLSFYKLNDYARGTVLGSQGGRTVFINLAGKLFAAQASDYKVHVFDIKGNALQVFGEKPEFYKRADKATIFKSSDVKSQEQFLKVTKKYKNNLPFVSVTNIFNVSDLICVQYSIKQPDDLENVKNKLEIYSLDGKHIAGNIDLPYTFWAKGEDGYYYFIEKEIFTEDNTLYLIGKFKERKQ